jgi:hypothetical protein
MRRILPLAILLAACSQQPSKPSIVPGTFAGEGRNRLCIAGESDSLRAGLIVFGQGDINCSASGRIEGQGSQLALVPRGEGPCRIPLVVEGNVIRIGEGAASCSYYCGPGASMAGQSFNRSDMGATAVDLAGDPLC